MGFLRLAWNSLGLHGIPWACMRFPSLASDSRGLHQIPWAYIRFPGPRHGVKHNMKSTFSVGKLKNVFSTSWVRLVVRGRGSAQLFTRVDWAHLLGCFGNVPQIGHESVLAFSEGSPSRPGTFLL